MEREEAETRKKQMEEETREEGARKRKHQEEGEIRESEEKDTEEDSEGEELKDFWGQAKKQAPDAGAKHPVNQDKDAEIQNKEVGDKTIMIAMGFDLT